MRIGYRLICLGFSVYLFSKLFKSHYSPNTVIVGVGLLLLLMVISHRSKKNSNTLDFKAVDTMEGLDFETFVTNLYEKLGYKAVTTVASGDFGADVVIEKGKERACIQCKRYKDVVGIKAVQEVIGSLKYYKANRGIVVTNSTYTDAAMALAKANDIELIDREKLIKMIKSVT